MESILTSIKKLLGLDKDYEHFDTDIMIHINSTFMNLTQIGVGPKTGFIIQDKTTTWSDFEADSIKAQAAKSYIYLKVRVIFDPPANSFLIDAMKNQATEIEWRLNVQAEGGLDNVQRAIDKNRYYRSE